VNKDQYDDDRFTVVRTAISNMLADNELIDPTFRIILEEAFNKEKEFGAHSLHYIQQLLHWFDESSPAIKDLQMILILKKGADEEQSS
jgi:hypothetical protein